MVRSSPSSRVMELTDTTGRSTALVILPVQNITFVTVKWTDCLHYVIMRLQHIVVPQLRHAGVGGGSGMQGSTPMVCFVVMFVTADAFLLFFFSFTRSGEKLCHMRATSGRQTVNHG